MSGRYCKWMLPNHQLNVAKCKSGLVENYHPWRRNRRADVTTLLEYMESDNTEGRGASLVLLSFNTVLLNYSTSSRTWDTQV